MKKLLPYIATVAALSLSVFCMFQISDLKDDIRRMENNFRSELSVLESNYSNIIALTEQRLEEHASILTRKEFIYGEMDLEKGIVELLTAITPKEHQPGTTEAVLMVDGKEYSMELIDGAYTGTVALPVFEESVVEQVVFREGDTVRTETLDQHFTPRYELLPSVSARVSGSARGSVENGVYVWHRTGEARVSVEGKGQIIDIQEVSLIEELDGMETNRIEIPLTSTESTKYGMEKAAPEPLRPGVQVDGAETFYHDLDREFSIPFGSTMNLFAEVVDGNGLRYRVCVEHIEIDDNGNQVDDDSWHIWDLLEWIIGPDGEILYEIDEAQYR